jgi:hypothetical protein
MSRGMLPVRADFRGAIQIFAAVALSKDSLGGRRRRKPRAGANPY